MADIKFSGFGGQGVLTAGLILSYVAMEYGYEVCWIPFYGSEMRGGTATCTIRMSNQRLGSPYIKRMDILAALNQHAVDDFEQEVKPGGLMLVNTSLVPAERKFRDDIRVLAIPANAIAKQADNPRGLNLVTLAAVVAGSGLFAKDVFEKNVEKFFADKGKSNPKNAACVAAGWEAGQQFAEACGVQHG